MILRDGGGYSGEGTNQCHLGYCIHNETWHLVHAKDGQGRSKRGHQDTMGATVNKDEVYLLSWHLLWELLSRLQVNL